MSGTPTIKCPGNLLYNPTKKICLQNVLCTGARTFSNNTSSSVQCYAPASLPINNGMTSDPLCPTDYTFDKATSKCYPIDSITSATCPSGKILDKVNAKCVPFVLATCNTPSAMMMPVSSTVGGAAGITTISTLKCVSCPINTPSTTYSYDTPSSSCVSTKKSTSIPTSEPTLS
jgi:hypothetical protein